jgi:hypothetical protein
MHTRAEPRAFRPLTAGSGRDPDCLLEGDGFELSVPRQRRHPPATANRLSRHHFPRNLGLRFAPKASTPSRKSSELPRKVAGSSQRSPLHAAGTRRCLHFRKMRAQTSGNSYLHGHRAGSRGARGKPGPRKITGVPRKGRRSTPPGPVGALHFGKSACKQAASRFPPIKREASPIDADGRQDHHACG